MRQAAWLVLAALVLPLGALEAQRLASNPFPSLDTRSLRPSPAEAAGAGRPGTHPLLLGLGGVVGGAAGLFAGAYVGARLADDCEDCDLGGAIFGGVAGGSAGIPVGVHLANGGRGRLLPSLGASLAICVIGMGAAEAANNSGIMIAVPIAQLVSSVLIERGTSPKPPN